MDVFFHVFPSILFGGSCLPGTHTVEAGVFYQPPDGGEGEGRVRLPKRQDKALKDGTDMSERPALLSQRL